MIVLTACVSKSYLSETELKSPNNSDPRPGWAVRIAWLLWYSSLI
jgi:hypothetical protein